MAAYMIAEIEVHDPRTYARYIEQARRIIPCYGGRYLARGPAIRLFGDWEPRRVLVIEFESVARLRECFESDEYKAIATLREASTTSRAIVMDGDAMAG